MKRANKTPHLAPREKQCSASLIDTGLQRRCNDIRIKIGLDLHVFDLNRHNSNIQKIAANDAMYYRKWRVVT